MGRLSSSSSQRENRSRILLSSNEKHASRSSSTVKPHYSLHDPAPDPTTSPSKHHIHLPHIPVPHVHIPFTSHNHHDGTSTTDHQNGTSTTKPPHPALNPKSSSKPPTRPTIGLARQTSVHTRYMTMLLAMDTIPRLHNILIAFFTWILLAGFVIFPGTFTSLSTLENRPDIASNTTASTILHTVKNIPLLVIAGACCGIGAAGMLWLWWKWRDNYVWLLNRIFLPGCLNSLAGLISTLINVYTQQDGAWSVTARITAIVTGACMVVTVGLFGLYNFWILRRVKKVHGREMRMGDWAHEGEGLVEKLGRKVHEPALEPGSVV